MVKKAKIRRRISTTDLRRIQTRAWRDWQWPAWRVAERLGVKRATFKKYESGLLRIPVERSERARDLEQELIEFERVERQDHRGQVEIVYDGVLPAQIVLCKCGRWWKAGRGKPCQHRRSKR